MGKKDLKFKVNSGEILLEDMYNDLLNKTKDEIELKYKCKGSDFRSFLVKNGFDIKTFVDYEKDRKTKVVLECFKDNKVIIDISRITNINPQIVSKILRDNGLGGEILKEYGLNRKNNIVGNKYGFLKVISYYDKDDKNNYMYNCICENCGHEIIVKGSYLRTGKKIDCGCTTKKRQSNAKKKYNEFDLNGDFGIGYTTKGDYFYFDKEDYYKIKDYCWSIHYGYIRARGTEGKFVSIHRIITGCKNNEQVDHINRNPIDNRKLNLRVCTNAENSRNKNIRNSNSTGFIGVSKRENGTYRVRIRKDGGEITIGHYVDIHEAVCARLKAELECYGEFSPQKHLFEEYGINVSRSDINE